MKVRLRYVLGLFFICIIIVYVIVSINSHKLYPKKLRVLHVSFHTGCIKDFEEVAKELGIKLTSWYILGDRPRFDGYSMGNAVYNIGHKRADLVWALHKNYFDQFDLIVTSDTAPLSRIFLQHGWKKPLIIWICNRFDYCDYASLDCNFPDKEYYDLFQKAASMPNVRIVSYTPVEYLWAAVRGVKIGTCTIKPVGSQEHRLRKGTESLIPADIDKTKTFFIPEYFSSEQKAYVLDQCKQHGIPVYCGRYNGPYDLKDFKGIIYIPYQWSNLALFENIYNGLVHFVPSALCVHECVAKGLPLRYCTLDPIYFKESEWYRQENTDLFVYFDSWADLARKIKTVDYEVVCARIKKFALHHRGTMMSRWHDIFTSLCPDGRYTSVARVN